MTAKTNPTPALTGMEAFLSAPGWLAEEEDRFPGAAVTGSIVHLDYLHSEWGPYPVVTLDTANGFVNIHAFHQVLRKQFAKLAPAIGDRITVTYLGLKEGKERPYHQYIVMNPDKTPEDFAWDDTDF